MASRTQPGESPTEVVHRGYVSASDAHYAGSLASGAFVLGRFGDVATELCIRTDGEEGLFASYSDVQFLAPVRAGDVIQVVGRLVHRGTRSRQIDFECRVTARACDLGGSRSLPLCPPLLTTTARGTVVVSRPVPPDGRDA